MKETRNRIWKGKGISKDREKKATEWIEFWRGILDEPDPELEAMSASLDVEFDDMTMYEDEYLEQRRKVLRSVLKYNGPKDWPKPPGVSGDLSGF
jgi:hypothetical protein